MEQPSLTRRERMLRLREAQDRRCSICGHHMSMKSIFSTNGLKWTFEHVWNRAKHRGLLGNVTLAHQACNTAKDNRAPTGCEIIMLLLVNARLGRMLAWRDDAPRKTHLNGMPTACDHR